MIINEIVTSCVSECVCVCVCLSVNAITEEVSNVLMRKFVGLMDIIQATLSFCWIADFARQY